MNIYHVLIWNVRFRASPHIKITPKLRTWHQSIAFRQPPRPTTAGMRLTLFVCFSVGELVDPLSLGDVSVEQAGSRAARVCPTKGEKEGELSGRNRAAAALISP